MDCNPPGSSVHGISQARILEGVAIPYSRGSSWIRDQTGAPSIKLAGGFLTTELPGKSLQWVLAAGERLDATLNTVWVIGPTWGLIDKTAHYVNLKNKD